jgi:hypothetical protein
MDQWFLGDGMMTLEVVEVFVIEQAYLPYHDNVIVKILSKS